MNEYYAFSRRTTLILKFCLLLFIFFSSFILVQFIIFANSLPWLTVPFLLTILLIAILRFEWGIYLFIFLIPLLSLLPSQLGVPNFSLIEMTFLVLVNVWFIRLLKVKKLQIKRTPLDIPLFIFLLIVVSSCLVTLFSLRYLPQKIFFYNLIEALKNIFIWHQEDRFFVLRGALTLIEGGLFYFFIANNIKNREMVRKIFTTIILSGLVITSYGIFQYVTGFQLLERWVRVTPYLRRINSTLPDVNSFGAYLVLILPLTTTLGVIAEWKKRVLLTILSLGLFLCLVFTSSRSSWIGFLTAFLFLSITTYRRKLYLYYKSSFLKNNFKRIFIGCLLLLFILLPFLITIANSYNISSKRNLHTPIDLILFTLNPNNMLDKIFSGRLSTYWKVGMEMIKDHPLFGVGVGSFIVHFKDYKNKIKYSQHPENAHNYFLQIGAELGLVGLVAFLYLIGMIFSYGFTALRSSSEAFWETTSLGILTGIFGFIVSCLAQHPLLLIEIQFIFWLFVYLIFLMGTPYRVKEGQYLCSFSKKLYLIIIFAIFASIPFRIVCLPKNKIIANHGFYSWEKWGGKVPFRWTKRVASERIEIKGRVLYLPILAYRPNISKNPVKLTIYFDGQKVDSITLNKNGWRIFSYPIANKNKRLIISFIIDRTWNPLKSGFNKDSRNLGIGVGEPSWDEIPSCFKCLNSEGMAMGQIKPSKEIIFTFSRLLFPFI